MTVLPDTNVILRYLIGDNPAQARAAGEFFEKVRTGREKALILESVLVECVYVLVKYYRVPRDETAARLSALLHYRGIANGDTRQILRALELFAEGKLDIVDCVLRSKADTGERRLFSFDERLKKTR